jgi:putative phosphoribosyl transferase
VPFVDRDQAGHALGERLGGTALVDPVVLALPRGGVPVGYQVAAVLAAPLDVIVVRKLGAPFQRELAMGAIGEGSVRVLDDDVLLARGLTDEEVDAAEARERQELERRVRQYRGGAPRIGLSGRTAVVVDDGMATGSTARAACSVARAQGAGYVVMGVPVASGHAVAQLEEVSDAVVVLEQPEPFYAVGQWYHRFDQTSDADVVALLARARGQTTHRAAERPPSDEERGRGPNAP